MLEDLSTIPGHDENPSFFSDWRDPREIAWSAAAWPGRVGGDPLASVEFFRDLVGRYREAGVSEVICQWQQDLPLDRIERIAAEVPALRGA